jgi:hypothetical protein
MERWDQKLQDLGGDPAREDWSLFRPLRLSREEDWSDWLSHLLERSRSGRRADIIASFKNGDWVHLEVKVGDLAFAKTAETGQALRRHRDGSNRGDFLLLPKVDMSIWESERSRLGTIADRIEVRTWHDVARALRRCIIEPDTESVPWRAWAYANAKDAVDEFERVVQERLVRAFEDKIWENFRDGVIAHCSRWDSFRVLRNVQLPNPQSPVKCGAIDRPQARLYVILDSSVGLAKLTEIGRTLLDEMDRALATKPLDQ